MKFKLKKCIPTVLFCLLVFSFFLLFFTELHPIVISDTDDWWYTYYHRDAVPVWKSWNPSRVFAEVFMPLVSMIGAYLVYPLTGNYFNSLSFCYAFSVALSITSLCYALIYYLRKHAYSDSKSSFLLCLYFLVSHFWVFRIHQSGNDYMFRAINSCTYFYYVIPNLLNTSLVLFLACLSAEGYQISNAKISVFIFLSYFCIFSNIWASLITASYIGSVLLLDLLYERKSKKFSLTGFIKVHKINLLILTIWIIAQVFELSGGRSDSLTEIDFASGIKESIHTLYFELTQINRPFLISAVAIFIIGLIINLSTRSFDNLKSELIFLFSALLSVLYLILSCAKTSPGYLHRTDVFYSVFFYLMVVLVLSLRSIIISFPRFKVFVPLLLFVALINCNTESKTYLESNICQFDPEQWNVVNEDIMQQFIDADSAGKTEFTLYIPSFQGEDNWPLACYASHRYSEHFYKMGITKNKIAVVEIVPTTAKNTELFIPNIFVS